MLLAGKNKALQSSQAHALELAMDDHQCLVNKIPVNIDVGDPLKVKRDNIINTYMQPLEFGRKPKLGGKRQGAEHGAF